MNLAIVLGTRPEIIKLSPVIWECVHKSIDYFILHTGQHYSYNMDRVFFEQLKLPEAKYNLDVGSGAHGEQTGRMITGRILLGMGGRERGLLKSLRGIYSSLMPDVGLSGTLSNKG